MGVHSQAKNSNSLSGSDQAFCFSGWWPKFGNPSTAAKEVNMKTHCLAWIWLLIAKIDTKFICHRSFCFLFSAQHARALTAFGGKPTHCWKDISTHTHTYFNMWLNTTSKKKKQQADSAEVLPSAHLKQAAEHPLMSPHRNRLAVLPPRDTSAHLDQLAELRPDYTSTHLFQLADLPPHYTSAHLNQFAKSPPNSQLTLTSLLSCIQFLWSEFLWSPWMNFLKKTRKIFLPWRLCLWVLLWGPLEFYVGWCLMRGKFIWFNIS